MLYVYIQHWSYYDVQFDSSIFRFTLPLYPHCPTWFETQSFHVWFASIVFFSIYSYSLIPLTQSVTRHHISSKFNSCTSKLSWLLRRCWYLSHWILIPQKTFIILKSLKKKTSWISIIKFIFLIYKHRTFIRKVSISYFTLNGPFLFPILSFVWSFYSSFTFCDLVCVLWENIYITPKFISKRAILILRNYLT